MSIQVVKDDCTNQGFDVDVNVQELEQWGQSDKIIPGVTTDEVQVNNILSQEHR